MPSAMSSGSSTSTKPKQYTCYLCSKTFDNIDILKETGETTKPQPPAGVY
jgi:hypothetical protein